MGAGKLVVVLVILAIVFMGGAAAIDAGLSGAGPDNDIEEEEFEPVDGETIALDFSNIDDATYSPTVTVYDNQDEVFPENGNYTWHDNNGTITVFEDSDLAAENNAFIDYTVTEPLDEASDMVELYALLGDNVQPALLIVVAFAVVLAAVRVFGGAR